MTSFPDSFDAASYEAFAEGLDYDSAMRMSEGGTWLYDRPGGPALVTVTGCEYRVFEKAHVWRVRMERPNGMETVADLRLDEIPGRMRRVASRGAGTLSLYDGTEVRFGVVA